MRKTKHQTKSLRSFTFVLLTTILASLVAHAQAPSPVYLQFDGVGNYVEVPNSDDFSVNTAGGLTVSAWMKPDTLIFPTPEGSGYVHWLGKGEPGRHEWTFRMYSLDNTEGRENRISFYVFNLAGGLGIGSYFQDPVTPGEWIHVVGVVDSERTYIYKNGVFRKCDQYRGVGDGTCHRYSEDRWIQPQNGTAPLRMGTRNLRSYFQGGLTKVRVWNRPLTETEIANLYASDLNNLPAPDNGLVAEWPLNEDTGTIARDTTGAHDGTIFGATWATE